MAIQHEIEALIVDTPVTWILQIIGTKPLSRKQRKKSCPTVFPPLVLNIIELGKRHVTEQKKEKHHMGFIYCRIVCDNVQVVLIQTSCSIMKSVVSNEQKKM